MNSLNRSFLKLLSLILFFFCLIPNFRINCKDLELNTVKIRDGTGRIVEIRGKKSRIISLAPSVTEILFALDIGIKLVGITNNSDFPMETKGLISVGSYIKPNLEKIVSLRPDICILVKGSNSINIIEFLNLFNIPVYIVDSDNFDSVLSSITEIGFILDLDENAFLLIQHLEKRIEHIKKIISRCQFKPSIFFQLGFNPIVSAGKGTFIDDMIKITNGVNIVKKLKKFPILADETVIRSNPDMIIIAPMIKNFILNKKTFFFDNCYYLSIFPNDYIFVENTDLFVRPSYRLIDGLEILAKKIHPNLFKEF